MFVKMHQFQKKKTNSHLFSQKGDCNGKSIKEKVYRNPKWYNNMKLKFIRIRKYVWWWYHFCSTSSSSLYKGDESCMYKKKHIFTFIFNQEHFSFGRSNWNENKIYQSFYENCHFARVKVLDWVDLSRWMRSFLKNTDLYAKVNYSYVNMTAVGRRSIVCLVVFFSSWIISYIIRTFIWAYC